MQDLNIVGAGRLGRTLGRLAHDSGAYRVAAVWCRDAAHAREAAAFTGAAQAVTTLAALPPAALTLISVPDGAIAAVAAALAASGRLTPGQVAFHASGALDASQLVVLSMQGVHVASLHPAFSFADPARALDAFAGTLCALEGDAEATRQLLPLVRAIGGEAFTLPAGGKVAYHAALSVASNYLVTLVDMAQQVAAGAGIDEMTSRRLLGTLMTQTLNNALALGPAPALTGPIVRGDAATVSRHLAQLPPKVAALYRALGQATLALASDQLDARQRAALAAVLADVAADSAR